MFEYLMPLLFMRTFQSSLLDHACRERRRQADRLRAARRKFRGAFPKPPTARSTPIRFISIARSAFPIWPFKPDLEEDLVVAPYATMLALMIDPQSAIPNLQQLDSLGLDGPMGFYESIDFSREAKRDGTAAWSFTPIWRITRE